MLLAEPWLPWRRYILVAAIGTLPAAIATEDCPASLATPVLPDEVDLMQRLADVRRRGERRSTAGWREGFLLGWPPTTAREVTNCTSNCTDDTVNSAHISSDTSTLGPTVSPTANLTSNSTANSTASSTANSNSTSNSNSTANSTSTANSNSTASSAAGSAAGSAADHAANTTGNRTASSKLPCEDAADCSSSCASNCTANCTANGTANCARSSTANGTDNSTANCTANFAASCTARCRAWCTASCMDSCSAENTTFPGFNFSGPRDLVLMHVPFNFGHTVEMVAMLNETLEGDAADTYISKIDSWTAPAPRETWPQVRAALRPHGEVWGHLNPDLQTISSATGCPLYFTPQKFWPKDTAAAYFRNRTIFGLLRDPYERLVAMFRGDIAGYGGPFAELANSCDVNGGVKALLKSYIQRNAFDHNCTLLPQSEYFDGEFGIQLAVDLREFPRSMNDVFAAHGYPDFQIRTEDVLHVQKCPEVWAGDLDAETRSLVQQVYAKDFELICQRFGHCDRSESTCLYQVPGMCPTRVLEGRYGIHRFRRGEV